MTKNQEGNMKKEFKDISKNGKDRKWKERKLMNIELGNRLEQLGYKQFERVMQCAEVLKFRRNEETLRLHQAWFCKNKLCPICNWRRAMKHSFQATKVIDEAMKREPKSKFLFLTLTVKNISGDELNQTMSELTKAFDRLFRRAKVQKNLIGFLRATEVTLNQKTEMYHPHVHVLLMMKSSYFKNSENYISQKEWQAMWKQSAKLDYEPIVDIRKVRPKKTETHEQNLKKAIVETAKYPVKPIDTLTASEEQKLKIVDDLMQGLYKKRQIGYGGLLKKIYKELQLEDVENGNLIQVDDEKNSESLGEEIVAVWNWQRQNYFVKT